MCTGAKGVGRLHVEKRRGVAVQMKGPQPISDYRTQKEDTQVRAGKHVAQIIPLLCLPCPNAVRLLRRLGAPSSEGQMYPHSYGDKTLETALLGKKTISLRGGRVR